MKLFHIDLETTGTDYKIHGILQLSGIIEIDGKGKERFNSFVKPFPGDVIEEKALEVNKVTRDQILTFPDPLTIYGKFIALMLKYIDKFDRQDKFHFIGYNSKFDDEFLRAWFEKCKDNYYGSYFFWPAIDVANQAAIHFMEKRKFFDNFKLMTVAKKAGIEVDENKAHDSEYDIKITRELFYKLKDGDNQNE